VIDSPREAFENCTKEVLREGDARVAVSQTGMWVNNVEQKVARRE